MSFSVAVLDLFYTLAQYLFASVRAASLSSKRWELWHPKYAFLCIACNGIVGQLWGPVAGYSYLLGMQLLVCFIPWLGSL